MTKSEKRILAKIRRDLRDVNYVRYDFWFVHDGENQDNAITWEGGFVLSLDHHFQNQYSIVPDKRVVKNW